MITTETFKGEPSKSGTLDPKISSVYSDFLTRLKQVAIGKYQLSPGVDTTLTGFPKASITTISFGSIWKNPQHIGRINIKLKILIKIMKSFSHPPRLR